MIKIVATALLFSLITFSALAADEPSTPLGDSMKKIAKAYKQLKLDLKTPSDASKKDYLDLIATIKTELQTSRGLVPKKADGLPDDQKTAMVTAFQKSIDDLAKSVDTLSGDIQDSKWDDANKEIDVILQQEKDGHKQFRKKED